MKIAFIHHERKTKTGAYYINALISQKLREHGVDVRHFHPRTRLLDTPNTLKGLHNILFFHSLLEHRDAVLRCDLIQGTTYTPLAFLPFERPVVCHFGSTTNGFLRATPKTTALEPALRRIWEEMLHAGVIRELNLRTRRPLLDIAEIERYVAQRATAVIATSAIVHHDLEDFGVAPTAMAVIHNAIENVWFAPVERSVAPPVIVYLGRLGSDVFTMKLKGLDRLIAVLRAFPTTPKVSIVMTENKKLAPWLTRAAPEHRVMTNVFPDAIRFEFAQRFGSILLVPSRYEGFCLSMVEGMSQGLVPVAFPVGVAPEILRNGENGYLVHSVEEMTARVRELLADPDRRLAMARAAMAAATRFQADTMAEQLIALYKRILGSGKGNRS